MTTLTITLENGLTQQVEQFAGELEISLEEAATELIRQKRRYSEVTCPAAVREGASPKGRHRGRGGYFRCCAGVASG